MKKLIALTPLLLLAACATPEQLAENARIQAEVDSNTCRGYGLRPGSDAFGTCRMQLDLARQQPYYYPSYGGYYGGYGPRFGTGISYIHH